ncbi:MAG: site-specific integrase [Deltaproteobacteria bacterium]|nr:site-specific integrase [Deltaproteobacteria bacterium]
MGLLVECPQCRRRNSQKAKACKCGFALSRYSGRVWWVEWYQDGQRRRERIGSNKEAAEQRLREVLKARAEGRYIRKSPDLATRFRDLAVWYLGLSEVQAKRSYVRDRLSVAHLNAFFGDRLLKEITPSLVEAYRHKRLGEPSGRTPDTLTTPATVNREIACLKTIFNKAIRDGKAERNPTKGVKLLREHNKRDRVLSPEEYSRLLDHCPPHLAPVVKLAYHTGMRQGEILGLKWGQVELKGGFIRLTPDQTKTAEGRLVPLPPELVEMFRAMPRGLPQTPVFTYKGQGVAEMKRSFKTAVKRAGIEDFTFHDLRHTFTTNAVRAGVPIPVIMEITGHKSLAMFKRYANPTPEDLKAAVSRLAGAMDTYMDTKAKNEGQPNG